MKLEGKLVPNSQLINKIQHFTLTAKTNFCAHPFKMMYCKSMEIFNVIYNYLIQRFQEYP